MEWFLWMLGVAILGLAAVASSGRLGELPPTVTSSYIPPPLEGDLDAAALRTVRFSVTARGYSMDQVDDLLDRLARQFEADQPTGPIPRSLEEDEQPRADASTDQPVGRRWAETSDQSSSA